MKYLLLQYQDLYSYGRLKSAISISKDTTSRGNW